MCIRDSFYLRRRKTSVSPTAFSNHRTNSSSVLSKFNRLLGRRTKPANYDQELEDGNRRLYNPNDFELGGIDSDEDDTSEGKLGSGYASPNVQRSESRKTPIPGRMTPDIMDRNGLLVRNESRERFGVGGRKSRNGSLSPKRLPR